MNRIVFIIVIIIDVMFVNANIASYSDVNDNDTICYNVSDYGLVGDGVTDDLPALNKLIMKISSKDKPIKLVFSAEKTYRIYGGEQDKYHRIFINRMNNITIDGNGSTLLVHPSSRAFTVYRSNNVVIKNFKIDYYPLPYTQGRVTKVEPENFYLEFVVDEDFPLPVVGDESYYKGGKMVDCTTANGNDNKFYQGHSWVKQVKDLGKRKYGVKYALRDQKQLRINDYFCMKVAYPSFEIMKNHSNLEDSEKNEWLYTDYGSIEALNTDGFIVDNVVSYSSPVMTFLYRGCSNHIIRNCSIMAKPGRIIAGNSDGIHLKGNEHQPIIESCYIERTMDDAIHIKISGDAITDILSPSKFKIAHMDNISDNTNLGVGKEVMLFDVETSTQIAMCKIIDYNPINHREGIVTIDKEVPNLSKNVNVYLQASGKAIITNCKFGTQLQRGILTHQPTIISDCEIVDNGKGLELALMSRGIEGPPTQFLLVDGCTFRNLSYIGLNVVCPSLKYDQKGVPQLIIKDCIFDLKDDIPVLSIENSRGFSFINNKIYYYKNKPIWTEKIKLINTDIIDVYNNKYEKM